MIPESIALIIALSNFVGGCLLGGLCGLVASVALRLPRSGRGFLLDSGIAGATMILVALAASSYYSTHGGLRDLVGLLLICSLVAPVVHQLIRFVGSRRRTQRNQ